MAVDVDVDGVGDAWRSLGKRLVSPVADIRQGDVGAVAAGDDDCRPTDSADRVVVVHIVRQTDAGLHAVVGNGGFYSIERIHLMIVDLNVFLTACQQ